VAKKTVCLQWKNIPYKKCVEWGLRRAK
jgi:hypothetical protein